MCKPGCLCDPCCQAARDFAYDHWQLDREFTRDFYAEPVPPLLSRAGRWHGIPDHDDYSEDSFP